MESIKSTLNSNKSTLVKLQWETHWQSIFVCYCLIKQTNDLHLTLHVSMYFYFVKQLLLKNEYRFLSIKTMWDQNSKVQRRKRVKRWCFKLLFDVFNVLNFLLILIDSKRLHLFLCCPSFQKKWNLYVYTNELNQNIITVWFYSKTFNFRETIYIDTLHFVQVSQSKYFWVKKHA